MLGKIQPLSGKIERGDFLYPSYFEQEVKAGNITPIDDVWNAFPTLGSTPSSCSTCSCGLKNDHISRPLNQLSGGEQAKVRLCKLMMNESNWLLFDEPTNHLDVIAKEELKRALKHIKAQLFLSAMNLNFTKAGLRKFGM